MSRFRRAETRRRWLALRPKTEALEALSLLSVTPGLVSPPETVIVQVPNTYVLAGTSEVDVTLDRFVTKTGAAPNDAMTVQLATNPVETMTYASVTSLPTSAQLSAPGVQYVPINESVTFQPGQTAVTIPFHLIPNAPNPGTVSVELAESGPSGQSNETLNIVTGPNQIPPAIVAAKLVRTGIALTFNRPLNPAIAGNVHNYVVTANVPWNTADDVKGFTDLVFNRMVFSLKAPPIIGLKSASYDPATNTVTLATKERLDSPSYNIASPPGLGTPKLARHNPHNIQALVDVNGDTFNSFYNGSGRFSITVGHKPWTTQNPEAVVG